MHLKKSCLTKNIKIKTLKSCYLLVTNFRKCPLKIAKEDFAHK